MTHRPPSVAKQEAERHTREDAAISSCVAEDMGAQALLIRTVSEDTPDARCRRLWLAVMGQVLKDAVWEDPDPHRDRYNQKAKEALRAKRAARIWLTDDRYEADRLEVVDRAGLSMTNFRAIVRRFVVEGDDPAPLKAALSLVMG